MVGIGNTKITEKWSLPVRRSQSIMAYIDNYNKYF